MKKILIMIITCFISVVNVYAECSDDEIEKLKPFVKNVDISYVVREPELGEYGMVYGIIDLVIQNVPDGFYVYSDYYEDEYAPENYENGIIYIYDHLYGKYTFNIYSEECDEEPIRSIKFVVPRYNPYSEDELCEGIPEGALDVCDTFYNYEINYDAFAKKVEKYKNSINNFAGDGDDGTFGIIGDSLNFLKENIIYVVSSLIIIGVIVAVIIVNKRRGELKWESFY